MLRTHNCSAEKMKKSQNFLRFCISFLNSWESRMFVQCISAVIYWSLSPQQWVNPELCLRSSLLPLVQVPGLVGMWACAGAQQLHGERARLWEPPPFPGRREVGERLGACANVAGAPGWWVTPGERMGRQTVRPFVRSRGESGRHLLLGSLRGLPVLGRLLRRGVHPAPSLVVPTRQQRCVFIAKCEAVTPGAPGAGRGWRPGRKHGERRGRARN